AGRFTQDNEGYIGVGGVRLQGFSANNGVIVAGGNLVDLQVSQEPRSASATTIISQNLNLDSSSIVPGGTFSSSDPATYNYKVDREIFDSLGTSHASAVYYEKTA